MLLYSCFFVFDFVDTGTQTSFRLKYSFLRMNFEGYRDTISLIESFSWSCLINFGFCTLAALCVYISPQAAGSGIPQV